MAGPWKPGFSHEPGITMEGDFRSKPGPSGTSLKGTDVEERVDTYLKSDSRKLIDDFNRSPNVERAKALAEMLESPNSVLKELTLETSGALVMGLGQTLRAPEFVSNEERMKCRLTVIEALSRSTKLVRLTIGKATTEEVHELCRSLAANKVLEELDLEFDFPADSVAERSFALLESNQSVKSLTLRFHDGIARPWKGVVGQAESLVNMLERPEIVLEKKGLDLFGFRNMDFLFNKECRLTVIKALSKSMKVVRLTIYMATEKEIHELRTILAANESVKSLTLCFYDKISEEGAAAVGSMLAENSTLEELVLHVGSRFIEPREPIPIEQVIRPLTGSDDGEPPRNTSLHTLTIEGEGDQWISFEGASAVARMLRTNKSLLSLRLPDCTHIEEMIRPLIGSDDGEPPLNTSLHTLTMERDGWISSEGASAVARMLRTNKSLLSLRLPDYYLNSSVINMIVKSLENNKTLQDLDIGDIMHDRDVQVVVRLLVKHNFTLKTIWYRSEPYSAEDFFKIVMEEHGINARIRGRPLFEGNEFLSPSMLINFQVQPTSENLSSSSDSMPNHEIYLSYFGDGRNFAKQLYLKLRASNYNVLNDPDSSDSTKEELSTTSEQRQLAIVVLSKGYVTSKQSMQELSRFVKRTNTSDSTLKVVPLFYKVALSDLASEKVELKWAKSWKELIEDDKVQEEEIGFWNETLEAIFDEKNATLKRGKALLTDLIQGRINAEDFCTQFNGACDVLELKNYCNSEEEYLLAVVKEIKKIIPPIMESKIDQMFGHLRMFELQSELSLQVMTSMLRATPLPVMTSMLRASLLANYFLLQRALNMGEYLQQKYIGCETFGVFDEHYDKGCTIATLFQKGFLYHFKAELLCGALNKVSKFDDKSCYPMLVSAAAAVENKWRTVCGHDYQGFYNTVEEGIAEMGNISEVSPKELEGEGMLVLCLYNANNNHLEYYFKNYQEMACIVGVGLEHAKATLINQREVEVEEILKEDWMKAWKEVESKPSTKWKVLKLESCMPNEEEQLMMKDKISSKPLVWELAKYFILKKSIEIFSIGALGAKYVTTKGDAHSQSQSSSGSGNNGSKMAGGFLSLFGNQRITSNGKKDQDRENGEDEKDDGGDDKKGKSLENHGSSDGKDNDGDTTVKVCLLAGGDIMDKDDLPPSTRELKFSILERTIIPSLEFTFINRNSFKKIQSTVGYIQFTLGTVPEHGKETEWSHTEMIIQFGIFGEEAQRKGELERDSLKHLDVEEVKQGSKIITTTEKKGGREFGGALKGGMNIHAGHLEGQIDTKFTKSVGNSRQLENSHERSVNRSEGGFEITDHIDPTEHEIACTYRVPSNDLHLATNLQKFKLQCTWVALDVGEHGSAEAFVPYTFIASRSLQKNVPRSSEENVSKELKNKGKSWNPLKITRKALIDEDTQQDLLLECTQKYERVLYINHAMTHLDGKLHTIKERREPDKCTFFSSETSLTKEYDWGNCSPLVKLPKSQTSSTVGALNDASTSSSGRQPPQT